MTNLEELACRMWLRHYEKWSANPERKMHELRKKPPGFDMWLQGGTPREIDATKGVPTQLIPADWCSDATPVSLSKEHREEHGNQVHPTASYKASKHVAIIAQTDALAAAMESVLSAKLKGHTFSRIARVSERPDRSRIATLGLPFSPGKDKVWVHAFGTRFMDNATKAERDAQWQILRSEDSSVEDVLAELSGFRDYLILSQSHVVEIKLAIADLKLAIAEAETIEDKCAAYKTGFEFLQEALASNV
jgi:hypothetical protein